MPLAPQGRKRNDSLFSDITNLVGASVTKPLEYKERTNSSVAEAFAHLNGGVAPWPKIAIEHVPADSATSL